MKYLLRNKGEMERLRRQVELPQYDLNTEFQNIKIKPTENVLEIGCGGGDVISFVKKKYQCHTSACDLLEEHIQHCKNQYKEIDFFTHNITEAATIKKYDVILLRYVAQHLGVELLSQAVENIKKMLVPNGRLIIIDVDGLMTNFYTSNKTLLENIRKISEAYPGDFNIGHKILPILFSKNFSVEYEAQGCHFKTLEEKELESQQWEKRLKFSGDFLKLVLGGDFLYKKFVAEFLDELKKPDSVYYMTKFIYEARL